MALSMEEQRILDEMAQQLADDDPRLATRLATLGRPGLAGLLRSRRARRVIAAAALMLVVVVSMLVYAMIASRPAAARQPVAHPPATPKQARQLHPAGGLRAGTPSS